MFDLFNSYDIGKLQKKQEELESRIKTLESLNGITFEPPVNKWIAKVNDLTKEEFQAFTKLLDTPAEQIIKTREDEVPAKTLALYYELGTTLRDNPDDAEGLSEVISSRRMDYIKDFTDACMSGDWGKVRGKGD